MAVFNGGPEPNTYGGTAEDDEIDGGGGNDTLNDGGAGHDTIYGGTGADHITGTNGSDLLEGQDGNDTIQSGEDADTLRGGIGEDSLTDTGGGNDILEGGEGNDILTDLFGTLLVSSGNDVLSGGNGNDIIRAGTGNDTMTGGTGVDSFDWGPRYTGIVQTDTVTDFELGIDRLDLGSLGISELETVQALFVNAGGDLSIQYRAVELQILNLTGISALTVLTAADFIFSADTTASVISGSTSSDDLFGGRGNDNISGFESADRLFGEHGDDTLNGMTDNDQLFGGSGNDDLNGGTEGNDTLDGGSGNDILTDGGLHSANDVLRGGAGNDTLSSGFGDDVLTGGVGFDRFDAGARRNSTVQTDTVTDFVHGEDKLDLRSIGIADFATVQYYLTTVSGDAAFRYLAGGATQTWLLQGVAPGSLTSASFIFSTENTPRSISGTTSRDDLFGGGGNDTIFATESDDVLWGADGADSLNGGSENDTLVGGAGADTLVGGNDNDTYRDVDLTDTIVEGNGLGSGLADIILTRFSFSLASLPGLEHLTLTGRANVNATGNGKANVLTGNTGNNLLDGADGADTLDGGLGNDTMIGGEGGDVYVVNSRNDIVTETNAGATGGSDTVLSGASSFTLGDSVEDISLTGTHNGEAIGNSLANRVTGNTGNNRLWGGSSNDTLSGGGGEDELRGDAGADSMTGGEGNDRYFVDDPGDQTIETDSNPSSGGIDTVFSTVTRTLGANLESLRLQGTGDIDGTGNELANRIYGTSGANLLKGLAGADTLDGKNGNDTIEGGEGNDTVTGGGGLDVYRFAATNAGVDTITDFSRNFDRFDLGGGSFSALGTAPNGDVILTHSGGAIRIQNPPNLTLVQWNALVLAGGQTARRSFDPDDAERSFDGPFRWERDDGPVGHGDYLMA